MFYVYTIYNQKHKKIYVGQTEDLEKRLRLHQQKVFVKSFTAQLDGEWILIYKEKAENRQQALLREKQLKSYQGRLFLRKYIPL